LRSDALVRYGLVFVVIEFHHHLEESLRSSR